MGFPCHRSWFLFESRNTWTKVRTHSQLETDYLQRYQEINELTIEKEYKPVFWKNSEKLRRNLKTKQSSVIYILRITSAEEKALSKRLNFAVSSKSPILNVVSSVESFKLFQAVIEEFRSKV